MAKSLRILDMGGAGFISSHLVKALVVTGFKVWVLNDLPTGSPLT